MAKTEAEKADLLKSLGLPTTGETLSPVVTSDEEFTIAPEGINPREWPVKDIKFDPRILNNYDLTSDRRYAAQFVFDFYKGPRGSDRNKAVWAAVGQFIEHVKDSRATGGLVKEKVKATAKERRLGKLLASLSDDEMVDIEEAVAKIRKKREE